MIKRMHQAASYRMRNFYNMIKHHFSGGKFAPKENLILLFHGLDENGSQRFNLRFTAKSDFLFLIDYLANYYNIVPLSDIGVVSQRPNLAITFDDGYRNWYYNLFPLIERYNIPVTLFISTPDTEILWTDQYDIYRSYYSKPIIIRGITFTKKGGFFRSNTGQELNHFLKNSDSTDIVSFQNQAKIDPDILSDNSVYWELLRESEIMDLSRSSYVTIGSHGCSHVSLEQLNDQKLKYELNNSKAKLEDLIQKEITYLSFPSGHYNERVKNEALAGGYSLLLAESYLNPTLDREDYVIHERTGIYSIGNKYTQLIYLVSSV